MNDDTDPEQTRIYRKPALTASAVVHALILREESGPPRRVTIGDERLRVGRHPANELVLSSPEVSRHHCELTIVSGTAMIADLGSTNGVYVDNRRLDGPTLLHSGARIAIGPFSLSYQRGTTEALLAAEEEEREQARAVAYIQAMLPRPLAVGSIQADWRFQPSARLGGDAFGYRWLEPGRFAMFLLDVSGHGLGSALLAASAANLLRGPGLGRCADDPAEVLRTVNAAFQMADHDDLFFTLWYGVYEVRQRALRYASAGHHPAFLVQGGALAPLMTKAPAIGLHPGSRFVAAQVEVLPKSCLYLFSDGAFETGQVDGVPGQVEDLVALLHDDPAPAELFELIRARIDRRPFEDDVSLLRFEFD